MDKQKTHKGWRFEKRQDAALENMSDEELDKALAELD